MKTSIIPGVHLWHVSMHFLYVFLSSHLPFFFNFLHFLVEILSLQVALLVVNSLSEIKTEKTFFRYFVGIVAIVHNRISCKHPFFFLVFSPCIVYCKVASRAHLVANDFQNVYEEKNWCLCTFQNWIVAQSTIRYRVGLVQRLGDIHKNISWIILDTYCSQSMIITFKCFYAERNVVQSF